MDKRIQDCFIYLFYSFSGLICFVRTAIGCFEISEDLGNATHLLRFILLYFCVMEKNSRNYNEKRNDFYVEKVSQRTSVVMECDDGICCS